MPASHLRLLRHERGLTLETLAGLAGVDKATISRIEHGHHQPKLSIVVAIARALDLTPGQLVDLLAAPEPVEVAS